MSLDKFLEVSFSDEEIFQLLTDAIVDIADYEDEITMESYLIDDLGLDSLGFLDLFFTIQTAIQREVSNQEMRMLILEEFGYQNDQNVLNLSDGEKDRLVYSKLQIKNFFNLIKRQLAKPGIEKIDFSLKVDSVFDEDKLQSYLYENFQKIKTSQLDAYLDKYKIEDDKLKTVVTESINNITLFDIFELLKNKNLLQDVLKDTAIAELNINDEKSFLTKIAELSADESEDLDSVIIKLFENEEVLSIVYDKVINIQIENVFDSELKKLEDSSIDNDLMDMIRETFNRDLKDEKIQQMMKAANVGSDLIEDVITDNFDEIAREETQRILQDNQLRQKLVQDYIRDNYDPSEVAGLNDPKKMQEIQTAITQKYINDNLDTIISRYMNKYMDDMLDSVEDDDIEIQGDLQDEFMKSFVGKVHQAPNLDKQEESDDFVNFIETYGIVDPVVISFIKANFEAVKSQVEIAQKINLDHAVLSKKIAQNFAPEPAFYFLCNLLNPNIISQIEKAFVTDQLENHMDAMMSSTIRTQLSFLGYDLEEEKQRIEAYIESCYDFILERFKAIDVTKEMVYEQAKTFKWTGISFFKLFESDQFCDYRRKIMYIFFDVHAKKHEYRDEFTQDYFDQFDQHFLAKKSRLSRMLIFELFFQNPNILIDERELALQEYTKIITYLVSLKDSEPFNYETGLLELSLGDKTNLYLNYFKSIAFDSSPEKIDEVINFLSEDSVHDTFTIEGRMGLDFYHLNQLLSKKEKIYNEFKSSFENDQAESNFAYKSIVENLSVEDQTEIVMLLSKFAEKTSLETDTLLKVVYKFSDQIMASYTELIEEIHEDLFVRAHSYILEQFDFFIADQLQEMLKDPKISQELIDKISNKILNKNSLRLFQQSLKGFFKSKEGHVFEINSDVETEFAFQVLIQELEIKSADLEGAGW
ncbi:MAG: hypothetical protein KC646_04130 [Candidatus Cloacimonetes bacterium]|nr:hypothetical protein [Candidatus Cloacimonadota bacterium]